MYQSLSGVHITPIFKIPIGTSFNYDGNLYLSLIEVMVINGVLIVCILLSSLSLGLDVIYE